MARRGIGPSRYATIVATELAHTSLASATSLATWTATESVRDAFELRTPIDKSDLGSDFAIHTVLAGEQLDELAFWLCGDSRFWWVLADLNQDVLTDTLEIPTGTKLIIPTEAFFNQGLP